MFSTEGPLINQYRNQLMGIAAIGVLCVHSNSIVNLPSYLNSLFGYGGIGVYIFVFLSSIGLYCSLKSRGGGTRSLNSTKEDFKEYLYPTCLLQQPGMESNIF